MEWFIYLLEIFHVSIWEAAIWQHLKRIAPLENAEGFQDVSESFWTLELFNQASLQGSPINLSSLSFFCFVPFDNWTKRDEPDFKQGRNSGDKHRLLTFA